MEGIIGRRHCLDGMKEGEEGRRESSRACSSLVGISRPY